MKATTKKILVWLYSPSLSEERWVGVDDLRLLVPALKNSGFRSLIALLKNQQLVATEAGRVRLTAYGRSLLEAQFPIFAGQLNSWTKEWSLIVFLTPPKSDLQFRYLRKFLLDQHCAQLSRGVYLYPGAISSETEKLLLKLYVGAVTVIKTNGWSFGDEKSMVGKLFLLSDLKTAYSGISDEIERLLKQKNKQKASSDQYKKAIFLVFDRWLSALNQDLGLLHFYYPETKGGVELLSRLQALF